MAKKGGVQQLQSEINSDDELLKFLEKDGLQVIDVYTEWCGPCLAMVGSLKKIKLEKGGDDLNLAIAKADTIEIFQRFRNKSEPTWVVTTQSKMINCAFGTNVPELMDMISLELDRYRKFLTGGYKWKYYELDEMSPIELERYKIQKAIEEEALRIEREAAEKKRNAYITFVSNEIISHSSDLGVTIFFPHVVTRDLYKKITEIGEKYELVAKDKKAFRLEPPELELLHHEIVNPLPDYLLEHLYEHDAFMICWKKADLELRPIEDVLGIFCEKIRDPQHYVDELGNVDPEVILPPILKTELIELTLEEYEVLKHLPEYLEYPKEMSEEEIEKNASLEKQLHGSAENKEEKKEETGEKEEKDEKEEDEKEEEKQEEEKQEEEKQEEKELGSESGSRSGSESNSDDSDTEKKHKRRVTIQDATETAEEPAETSADELKDLIKSESEISEFIIPHAKIPPIWSPGNARATALFIYHFFRNLTDHYLPPDPVPEPEHLLITFEAYKRKEVFELITKHREDILAYGYFDSDELEKPRLIANSHLKYENGHPSISDKLVLKVSKKTSNTMLAFTLCQPNYISQNTEEGKEECLIFFPENYVMGSEVKEVEGEDAEEIKEPFAEVEIKKENANEVAA